MAFKSNAQGRNQRWICPCPMEHPLLLTQTMATQFSSSFTPDSAIILGIFSYQRISRPCHLWLQSIHRIWQVPISPLPSQHLLLCWPLSPLPTTTPTSSAMLCSSYCHLTLDCFACSALAVPMLPITQTFWLYPEVVLTSKADHVNTLFSSLCGLSNSTKT